MNLNQLASAILNDVLAGLKGINSNIPLSVEQIEDEIIEERLTLIKEYAIKGILPIKDLWVSVNCLDVDCKPIEACNLCSTTFVPRETNLPHVEIPQIITDLGIDSIPYFGTVDRQTQYKVYTDHSYQVHKYNKWIGKKPYIYVDTTPNENNLYDCYIFNAPLIKTLSAVIIPKDPRQMSYYKCCNMDEIENLNFLANDIKKRITERKVRWYRQLTMPITPNDQTIKP